MKKINLPEWDAPLCPEINNVLTKRDIDTIRYKTLVQFATQGEGKYNTWASIEAEQDNLRENELEGKTIMQAASLYNEVYAPEGENETEWWLQKILCDLYPEKYQNV